MRCTRCNFCTEEQINTHTTTELIWNIKRMDHSVSNWCCKNSRGQAGPPERPHPVTSTEYFSMFLTFHVWLRLTTTIKPTRWWWNIFHISRLVAACQNSHGKLCRSSWSDLLSTDWMPFLTTNQRHLSQVIISFSHNLHCFAGLLISQYKYRYR